MTPRGVFLHGYGQNIATRLDSDTLLGGMRNHEAKSQPSGRGEVASTAANAAANRGHRTAGGCLESACAIRHHATLCERNHYLEYSHEADSGVQEIM
jgi:hypothetical protein